MSLRPLAAAIGSSPRVLLYLFGSKEGLTRRCWRARADELESLAALRRGTGWARSRGRSGRWLAAPGHRGVLVLWLEGYARSLTEPGGPWGRFARSTVEDWLALLAAAQRPGCAAPAPGRRSARRCWASCAAACSTSSRRGRPRACPGRSSRGSRGSATDRRGPCVPKLAHGGGTSDGVVPGRRRTSNHQPEGYLPCLRSRSSSPCARLAPRTGYLALCEPAGPADLFAAPSAHPVQAGATVPVTWRALDADGAPNRRPRPLRRPHLHRGARARGPCGRTGTRATSATAIGASPGTRRAATPASAGR